MGVGGIDMNSRSHDINRDTVVGQLISDVVLISCTDSAGRGFGSRRNSEGIHVGVSGGHGNEVTLSTQGGGSVVHGLREITRNTQIHDNTVRARPIGSIPRDVIHAGNDARVGTVALAIKNLDAVNMGPFGNTKGLAANDSGNMCSVPLLVLIMPRDKAGDRDGTAFKLLFKGKAKVSSLQSSF